MSRQNYNGEAFNNIAKQISKEEDKQVKHYTVNDLIITCQSWNSAESETGRFFTVIVSDNDFNVLFSRKVTTKEEGNEAFLTAKKYCEV